MRAAGGRRLGARPLATSGVRVAVLVGVAERRVVVGVRGGRRGVGGAGALGARLAPVLVGLAARVFFGHARVLPAGRRSGARAASSGPTCSASSANAASIGTTALRTARSASGVSNRPRTAIIPRTKRG